MRLPRLALLVVAALVFAACPDPADTPQVSEDPRLQAKYELARRVLADIKLARARKRDFYGDCRAVQLLAAKELRQATKPAIRKLVEELDALCKGAKPY